jgi:FkbM family methyltransferase
MVPDASDEVVETEEKPEILPHIWIAEQFPPNFIGYALEVGANDGYFLSTCLPMERAGWVVMCVEANPGYVPLLRSRRKRFMSCAVDNVPKDWETFHISGGDASAYSSLRPLPGSTKREIKVPVLTLDLVLHISGFHELDVLAMDIEGTELDALKGFNVDRWRPRVIWVECWPGTDAAEQIAEYLKPFGYEDRITLHVDHGFVRA